MRFSIAFLLALAGCGPVAEDPQPPPVDAGADASPPSDGGPDGGPACVVASSDCVDAGPCLPASCAAGECHYEAVAEGTPIDDPSNGPCSHRECDGHGGEQSQNLCDAGH